MSEKKQKAFKLEVKGTKADGSFEGFCSVFQNIDSDNEIVDKGAFTRTLKETNGICPVLWGHQRLQPCGWNKTAVESDHGLKVSALLLMDTEIGRYAHAFVSKGLEVGARPGLSIGFTVPPGGQYVRDGIRHFRDIDLVEFSICVFPSNSEAVVTSAKARQVPTPPPGPPAPLDIGAVLRRARAWDEIAAKERVLRRLLWA